MAKVLSKGVASRISTELQNIYYETGKSSSIQKLSGDRYVMDSTVMYMIAREIESLTSEQTIYRRGEGSLIDHIAKVVEPALDCDMYQIVEGGTRLLVVMRRPSAALSFELTYDLEWRKQHGF